MYSTEFTIKSAMGAVTGKKSSRWTLGAIQVTPGETGKVWLTGTNGQAAAMREADGTTQTEVLCPSAALPKGKQAGTVRYVVNAEQWVNNIGEFVAGVAGGRYPRCEEAFPVMTSQDTIAVTLDPALLMNVAKALADPMGRQRGLTLFIRIPQCEITDSNYDLAIAILGPCEGIGVIMPIMPRDASMRKYEALRQAYCTAKDRSRAAAAATQAAG